MKAIIPCAGYGTRMGMKPNESKEMLADPYSLGGRQPVIDYCLEACAAARIKPVIITRGEKADLIDYCKDKAEVVIIEPKGEWPDTMLAAYASWGQHNVLILPDTRFAPTQVLTWIKNDLEVLGAKSSVALHLVQDAYNWCMVRDYVIVEKPANPVARGYAMGLMGFKKSEGLLLFNSLRTRGRIENLKDSSFHYLEYFKDITRTGKIEY